MIFSPQLKRVSNGVSNTAQAVLRLKQRGAKHILIVNVPDLGVIPYSRTIGLSAQITQLCMAYNQVLSSTLDSLNDVGAPTIRVNGFATLQSMALNPQKFGFTNAADPFLTTGGNPGQFLFWDNVHPATIGHAVLAQEAVNSLVAAFSPRKGNGTPPARVNALRGLVRAQGN